MAATLPYLAAPGSIKTALERIRTAATPDRVTRDFISTKLQIKGGTGGALIPFLKKLRFIGTDGVPTDLYKRFRNASTGGGAVAEAIKTAYSPLGEVNEYFFDLEDAELLNLIVQVTGLQRNDAVTKLIHSTLKAVKAFANFDAPKEDATATYKPAETQRSTPTGETQPPKSHASLGLNLSYTINLNLPATSDQAVFNAIFRSLKEHLLSNDE